MGVSADMGDLVQHDHGALERQQAASDEGLVPERVEHPAHASGPKQRVQQYRRLDPDDTVPPDGCGTIDGFDHGADPGIRFIDQGPLVIRRAGATALDVGAVDLGRRFTDQGGYCFLADPVGPEVDFCLDGETMVVQSPSPEKDEVTGRQETKNRKESAAVEEIGHQQDRSRQQDIQQ